MTSDAWLGYLDAEYLASFISEGGSSVKVIVPFDAASRQQASVGIAERARERGYVVATVDAAVTRVHLMHQLFFQVSQQIPWTDLSYDVVRALAQGSYPEPVSSDGTLADRLARDFGVDPDALAVTLKRVIDDHVFRDYGMYRDFRIAMMHLCDAQLFMTRGISADNTILDWLTGKNTLLGPVKRYGIYTKIDRGSARHAFESLLYWVRRAGRPGIVIVLDASRLTAARNLRDGSVYYTKAAVLDAYEVLRQFVDSTDRTEGCMLTVFADQEFLDEDPGGRGMGAYQALKFRVFDEVRDPLRPNPMSALIRLGTRRD
jgi:hypothetical protein